MKKHIYEAKTIEEAKEKALNELNVAEENLIINIRKRFTKRLTRKKKRCIIHNS